MFVSASVLDFKSLAIFNWSGETDLHEFCIFCVLVI